MDRFVKNFIGMSIVYLFIASVFGIVMLAHPDLLGLKFVHSHLNLLGWVSMMIFGVGYHILPRFMGRPLKSPKLGELQFWLANVGLVGMLFFYALGSFRSGAGVYTGLTVAFGLIEAFSIFLFFYNMLATIYAKSEA
jgi:cbb3-type cytochrome oxidase subunit 1